jgi:hypothetical protein
VSVIFALPLAFSWRSIASLLKQSSEASWTVANMTARALACSRIEGVSYSYDGGNHESAECVRTALTVNPHEAAVALAADARELAALASRGRWLGVTLVLLQSALAARAALSLYAFRRGVKSRQWYIGHRKWTLPPRRLATRCAYRMLPQTRPNAGGSVLPCVCMWPSHARVRRLSIRA